MTKPTDRKIFECQIATCWFDDRLLVSLSKKPKRTLANIAGNVSLVKSISGDKGVPLLIYLSNSPVPGKETRKFRTEQLPVIYSAMAIVSKPGLAKFIINILLMLKPPPIPMKSFTDDKAVKEWLIKYLQILLIKFSICR